MRREVEKGMKTVRRETFWLLAAVFLTSASIVEAQASKEISRIGVLSPDSISVRANLYDAFRQSLRDLGYIEGRNIIFEWRSAELKLDRLHGLAADLVSMKVDVIVVTGTPAAQAAKKATRTVPIVMSVAGDPVEAGIIASLARPGGNITGITSIAGGLSGKRLELLKECVLGLSRVAILREPDYSPTSSTFKEAEVAAKSLGIRLQSLDVHRPEDLEALFRVATKAGVHGLIHLRNPIIVREMTRIIELANKSRLPAVYDDRIHVNSGGLMSYGTSVTDAYRRLAIFVDKILKGAKPADIPVEQPTKFELVINLKAAKQIGLTISPTVLARADRVIK
jgi:putative ABC transport system substrate-binding protein